MSSLDADVLIAGAGLSGLSLAVALLDAGLPESARVVLVDPRDALRGEDRTWCYFETTSTSRARHAFEPAIAHRWSRWRVRDNGTEVIRSGAGIAYCHIPGPSLYAHALARLEAAGPRVRLVLGASVTSLDDRGGHVEAQTSRGVLRARLAMDSRPPLLAPTAPSGVKSGPVRLLQHFRGRVVHAATPAFDADTATLMDFDVTRAHGIHFAYVLPFDARTALVESTFFTEQLLPESTYERAIDSWLSERLPGHAFDTRAHEHGVIPMTTEPFDAWPSPRVVRIGTAGGHAKPSTGYAFLAVQRFVRAFAPRVVNALRTDTHAEPPPVRSARTAALDTIFLSYLRRHPERAPHTFHRLFERVPAPVLVRFLSDTGSLADDLRVISACDIPGLSLESLRATPLLRGLMRQPHR